MLFCTRLVDQGNVPGMPGTTHPLRQPERHLHHIVHAAKESMNPTPPFKQVDLLEVVLPEPPTPSPAGEPAPSHGRTIGLRRKDSEDDLGETVEVDLS